MTTKVEKWLMANGNYQWVKPPTMINISLVYAEVVRLTGKNTFGTFWISKNNLQNILKTQHNKPKSSVTTAINFLAYVHDPVLRIRADPNWGKVGEKVCLLRKIIDEDDEVEEN